MLEGIYPGLARNHTIFYWVLFSFPLLLSGFIAFYIHRFVKSDIKWLMQFILLTFLMCLLPSVSHDYKLVILSSGLVLYSLFFVLWLAGLNVKIYSLIVSVNLIGFTDHFRISPTVT